MTVKIRAEPVVGRDLRPGDLFSTAGPAYWDQWDQRGSCGERVYVRTNAPADLVPDADETVYRVTVVHAYDEKWEDYSHGCTDAFPPTQQVGAEEMVASILEDFQEKRLAIDESDTPLTPEDFQTVAKFVVYRLLVQFRPDLFAGAGPSCEFCHGAAHPSADKVNGVTMCGDCFAVFEQACTPKEVNP